MNILKLYEYADGELIRRHTLALASIEDVVNARRVIIKSILHGADRMEIFKGGESAFSVLAGKIRCLGRFFYLNKMQGEQSTFMAHVVQALHVKFRTKRPLSPDVYQRLEHERSELNCKAFKAIYTELLNELLEN